MPHNRMSTVFAAIAVAATAATAVWGFQVDPGPAFRWFFLGAFLPALWAFVEFGQVRGDDPTVGAAIMTFHRYTIAWAGLMLASQLGLRLLIHQGFLDPSWTPAVQRLRGILLGAGMIGFGNLLPTLRSPWSLRRQPFAWQQVHRFVGWTLVLAGLGVVVSWAVLPPTAARRASIVICGIAFTLALARKLGSVTAHSFGSR